MGKDLKGRELGVGITQRKDGLYTARYTDRKGKRRQKYFKKLQECRNWRADMQFNKEHGDIETCSDMSVETWFYYWITEIKGGNIRQNTVKNYTERFEKNIKDYIGNMVLADVKPLHCQNVLNKMSEKYRNSSIELTRITMYGMFESAVENELIIRNPVTKAVKCSSRKKTKNKRVLTSDEQKILLEAAQGTDNYNQYAFLL